MRRFLATVAAGFVPLCIAASGGASEGPKVPEKVKPAEGVTVETIYAPRQTSATTAEEMFAEVSGAGPHIDLAQTEWRLMPHFTFQRFPGGCETGPVETTVVMTIQLPVWDSMSQETEEASPPWQLMIPKMLQHEGLHRDNGVLAANALQEALSKLGAEPTCNQLQARARDTLKRVAAEYRRRDRKLDEASRGRIIRGFGVQTREAPPHGEAPDRAAPE